MSVGEDGDDEEDDDDGGRADVRRDGFEKRKRMKEVGVVRGKLGMTAVFVPPPVKSPPLRLL